MSIHDRSVIVRRLTLCLLPLAAGMGTALVLLLLSGRPARLAYAGTLTYPGCASTIQGCIDSASPGDTILIQAGDYTESLTLSKAVSLTGELSSTTILHALPNTRVLTVTGAAVDSSVVISGLTFTGGQVTGTVSCPDGCGGGIQIAGAAQPQLVDVTILSNTAFGSGGGIYVDNSSSLVLSQGEVVSNTSASTGGGIANGTGTLLVTNSVVHGNRGYSGGGIFNVGTVMITNTVISNNVATYEGSGGGGIESAGAAILNNTTVMSKTGYYGGGIDSAYNLLLVTRSTISGNVSLYIGGGVHIYQSTGTISDTLIVNNIATYTGGGIINWSSTLTVTGSEISGNTASSSYGGGIDNELGVLRIVDTTLDGNTASEGGGLHSYGTLTMTNATVSGNNTGSQQSAALWISGGSANLHNSTIAYNPGTGIGATAPVTLENTIVAANAPDCSGAITSQGYNLLGSTLGCTISGVIVGNVTGQDAHLGPLLNNGGSSLTHALLSGSPAINGGNPAGCRDDLGGLLSSDERGLARPQGAACDIGAYEAILADLQITQTYPLQSVHIGDAITYSWQISNAGPSPATGIVLSDSLPVTLTFGWVTASQGSCGGASTLNCNLGALAPGASLAITLVVTPTALGQILDTASVAGLEADPTFPDVANSVVTVLDRPVVGLGIASNSPTLLGNATTFTASIAGGTSVSYAWGFGDGDLAVAGPALVVSHTYTLPGAYLAVVTATNSAGQATATAVVTVNDIPVAAGDAYATPPNVALHVAAPGVLANDSDAFPGGITAQLAVGPVIGTLVLAPTGAFTYTPPISFAGLVTFTYRASDGLLLSAPAVVTLDIHYELFLPVVVK